LLDCAIDGHGVVVGVVGSPGIGKSRLVREVAALAGRRDVEVFTAFCESHTNQVHFHAVARLLRAATGVEGLDGQTARDRVHDRVPDADPEDLLLLHDLLGIADPDVEPPKIDPDARRRRLTAGQCRVTGPHRPGGLCYRGHALDRRGQRVVAG
jgi:predicted ATPase